MKESDIIGVWELIGCEGKSSDGSTFLPYGAEPKGKLMYSSDGHLSVILMDTSRSLFHSEDISQATSKEISAAFQSFDAYSGTWRLDERAGKIEHIIEAGRIPNWVGHTHHRSIAISEDILTLTTDEFPMAGKTWRVYVTWRRPSGS